MGSEKIKIKDIPISVKNGVSLLFVGWIWFLFCIYSYYDEKFLIRFFIGGVVLIYCVLQFKKWARMLALFCNAITILYCTAFTVLFHLSGSNPKVVAASAVNVLLFIFSSFFFLQKTSAAFFSSGKNPKT
jgi:hypothetical protein